MFTLEVLPSPTLTAARGAACSRYGPGHSGPLHTVKSWPHSKLSQTWKKSVCHRAGLEDKPPSTSAQWTGCLPKRGLLCSLIS